MNKLERNSLHGFDEFTYKLYIHALRPYMDYATGWVGVRRGISWQGIAEDMYLEPRSGIGNTGLPNRSRLRRSVKLLEKIGLIKNRSLGKKLIFELLLAKRDGSVQKQADTPLTPQADIEADTSFKLQHSHFKLKITNQYRQADIEADIPKKAQADTPPYIYIKKSNCFTKNVKQLPKEKVHLPDWMPVDKWQEFLNFRKEIKKPLTLHGEQLNIKKLEHLRANGQDPLAVIEQSIMNGWQGLFALNVDRSFLHEKGIRFRGYSRAETIEAAIIGRAFEPD